MPEPSAATLTNPRWDERWWEKRPHTQDPSEPRECLCGMSWPCPIGTAIAERDATRHAQQQAADLADMAWNVVQRYNGPEIDSLDDDVIFDGFVNDMMFHLQDTKLGSDAWNRRVAAERDASSAGKS